MHCNRIILNDSFNDGTVSSIKNKYTLEIKLFSFPNIQTAALLGPLLTAITQPAYDFGSEAASILFKLIERNSTRKK